MLNFQELSRQLEDSVLQLDGKFDEIKANEEDAKEALSHGLSELEDKLGKKILDSTNDLSLKYDEKLDKNLENLSNQIGEKLDNKLIDVKLGMDEMEKNVADALENEKADREKLDDYKMLYNINCICVLAFCPYIWMCSLRDTVGKKTTYFQSVIHRRRMHQCLI